MAKYYGVIGYMTTEETSPGVWTEVITERPYTGDITRAVRRFERSETLNDDLTLNNTISIVADAYAYDNIFAMKYIEWMGSYWQISSIEVQRPRLLLTIGGVYNKPDESDDGDVEESEDRITRDS